MVLTIGNRTFNGSVDVLPSGRLGYQIDVDTDVLKANTSIDAKVTGGMRPATRTASTYPILTWLMIMPKAEFPSTTVLREIT